MVADPENLYDLGVLEACDGLGLGVEASRGLGAGQVAGQDHLEGDQSAEPFGPRLVHDSHPASPEFLQDFISGDARRGLGGGCTPRGSAFRSLIRRPDGGKCDGNPILSPREPGPIFFERWSLAGPPPIGDLEDHQLAQQCRVDGASRIGEPILDRGMNARR